MISPLSQRVQAIKPSPTIAVSTRASELKAQGKNVLGLGAGEPDFDTPEHIKKAAIEAIQAGFTKYTPVDGIPELKQAVIDKFKRENQLNYDANQVIVSSGAKQSLFNLVQAILNPGDEVLIPAPYWVSYPDIAFLAGGEAKIIQADLTAGYKITAEQLDRAITPKSKLFIMNSPSNPSGALYSRCELAAIGEVLLNHPEITIVSDDIYEHIRWDKEPFSNIVNACPGLYERTIVVNGVSKAYAMTGWRIGYAAGPENIIRAMKKIQSQSTSNPTSISQKAAVAALNGDQSAIENMRQSYQDRHEVVYNRLKQIENVEVSPAQGAFYIFPNIQKVIDTRNDINNDVEFAEQLLQAVGVALVPGSAFGCNGCIRISLATSMDILKDALNRIEKFIQG